jgi:hypothetical protein
MIIIWWFLLLEVPSSQPPFPRNNHSSHAPGVICTAALEDRDEGRLLFRFLLSFTPLSAKQAGLFYWWTTKERKLPVTFQKKKSEGASTGLLRASCTGVGCDPYHSQGGTEICSVPCQRGVPTYPQLGVGKDIEKQPDWETEPAQIMSSGRGTGIMAWHWGFHRLWREFRC